MKSLATGTAFDPANLDPEGEQLRLRGPTRDAYKAPLQALRSWAKGRSSAEALVGALTHHGWHRGGRLPCRPSDNEALHARLTGWVKSGDLSGALYAIGEPTGPQIAGCMASLAAAGAPTGDLWELWACYGGTVQNGSAADDVDIETGGVAKVADVRAVKQLREMSAYVAIVDAAKEYGATLVATLLTHVGWNSPDGLLSLHRSTSHVGREAFAAVGFAEEGPTGVSIPEVLMRAARLSTDQGFARLARQIVGFVAESWPERFERIGGGLYQGIDSASSDDLVAESSAVDSAEVEDLFARSADGKFSVPDRQVTAKTRGSAQRVFADRVKRNYGWQCALTGIATREFLVASHIVPWSEDESIRLDPANGICLSTFVDRAFDTGYLAIREDYSVHVDWDRVGADVALRAVLEQVDGRSLTLPAASHPDRALLRRRVEGQETDVAEMWQDKQP